MQNTIKKAFTLAEVLITLGIIGVVAAMTIPTLMNNYEKQQYLTGLKKAYTITNQALVQMAADQGCTGDLKCTGFFDTGTTNKSFGDDLVKYFQALKVCSDNSVTGCFPDKVAQNYDGTTQNNNWDSGSYRFITADGMAFRVRNSSWGCQNGGSKSITNNLTQTCGDIMIDVNGLKGPNYLGKDIYMFYISNGKGPLLYPFGGVDDGTSNLKSDDGTINECCPSNTRGVNCAARIIEEGWKIDYETGKFAASGGGGGAE